MPAKPSIEDCDDGVLLRVRVQPRASRDEVILDNSGRIRVRLTAPPVENAANQALLHLFVSKLAVPRSAVRLVHGAKGREKVIHVDGVDSEAILGKLSNGRDMTNKKREP